MYYTVSGKSPQLTGVHTDIAIPGILSELDIGEEFSKFPLPNDSIEPHFEDDLSDIPAAHRQEILRLYKFNLQPRLTTYQPYLDLLKTNSQTRLQSNAPYQSFLKLIANKDFNSEVIEQFSHRDLQLDETLNIMKDLIYLMEQSPSS